MNVKRLAKALGASKVRSVGKIEFPSFIPKHVGEFKVGQRVWMVEDNIMIGGQQLKHPWIVTPITIQYSPIFNGRPYYSGSFDKLGSIDGVHEKDIFTTKTLALKEATRRNRI